MVRTLSLPFVAASHEFAVSVPTLTVLRVVRKLHIGTPLFTLVTQVTTLQRFTVINLDPSDGVLSVALSLLLRGIG